MKYLNKIYSYEDRGPIQRCHQACGRRVGLMKLTRGVNGYRNCGEKDGVLARRELLINYRMKNMCSGAGELC